MKLNLYEQSGSDNHGCEAIIKSTIDMLGDSFDSIELFSQLPESEYKYGLDKVCNIHNQGETIKVGSLRHIYGKLVYSIFPFYSPFYDAIHKEYLKSSGLSLQTGGDNYCYGNQYRMLSYINSKTKRKGMISVLWGVSIDPEIVKIKKVTNNLKKYDLITVRESITYQAMKDVGVEKNVYLCPDPAFTLTYEPISNNPYRGFIGINLSPLVLRDSSNADLIFNNYINLIDYILNNSREQILLIPHVIVNNNDDRVPLNRLYELFKHTNRVYMLEDNDCRVLKSYISECSFFVGARTHSTIAAYSTCVPTLVLGYSVKSLGIAKDIFGTSKDYVVSTDSLLTERDLLNAFIKLFNEKEVIRNELLKVMPGYINASYLSRNRIMELINQ